MKKILHISKFYPELNGGIENITGSTCNILSKKFFIDILGFSTRNQKKTIKKINKNIRIINFPTDLLIKSTPISFKIVSFIKNNINNYDAIHLYLPNPWIMLFVVLYLQKSKKIFITWGSDIINQKFLKFFILPVQNLLLKRAKKIIVLSRNYFLYSKDLLDYEKKIILVPPAMHENFTKLKKKNSNTLNILNVGRLVPYKNQIVLLEILENIKININIQIIGNGELYKKFQNIIKKKKLQNRIQVLNNINNKQLRNKFLECDIFCFTSNSRAESFGIAALEALSYGKALLMNNNVGSGMMDMIKNNYNGYIFKNKKDLINKINYIYNNKKILKKFSNNSKKIFQKKYNLNIISKKILKIYGNLSK